MYNLSYKTTNLWNLQIWFSIQMWSVKAWKKNCVCGLVIKNQLYIPKNLAFGKGGNSSSLRCLWLKIFKSSWWSFLKSLNLRHTAICNNQIRHIQSWQIFYYADPNYPNILIIWTFFSCPLCFSISSRNDQWNPYWNNLFILNCT